MELEGYERFGCVVYARRVLDAVDEVLVQWDCSWVASEGAWSEGQVVEILMRGRIVAGKQQVLVQWKCTWIPVEHADAGAVEDYEARCLENTAGEPTVADSCAGGQAIETVAAVGVSTRAMKKAKSTKNNRC